MELVFAIVAGITIVVLLVWYKRAINRTVAVLDNSLLTLEEETEKMAKSAVARNLHSTQAIAEQYNINAEELEAIFQAKKGGSK